MELGTLARILKVARHFGGYHLPLDQVMPIQYGSKHKPRTRWLTPEELAAVCAQLPRHRAAHVVFFVATGARRGEAERARRADVNAARTLIHLRGTKTARAEDDVPITALTRPLLHFAMLNAPGSDLLFRPWGKLNRDLAQACERAGVEKCSPNDLRRTFGKWHRLAGVSTQEIGPMLRHTTDKLAQTTYANARGLELGQLVEGSLRHLPAVVPILYRGMAETGLVESQQEPPDTGKLSAPGTDRTYDLRFRKAEHSSVFVRELPGEPSSTVGASVPILYVDNPAATAISTLLRRGFWLTSAAWFRRAA
jgi:hypothetical protein